MENQSRNPILSEKGGQYNTKRSQSTADIPASDPHPCLIAAGEYL